MKLTVILLFLFYFNVPASHEITFYHTPVREAVENTKVEIEGAVSEYNKTDKLYVLFRKLGVRKYKKILMKHTKGKNYEIKLPKSVAKIPGFEYFIVLKSKKYGVVEVFANKWEPVTVRVLKRDLSKLTKQELNYELFLEEQETRKEVVSASKISQKITEAPSTITVITAKDIEDSGVYSLPDLFRSIPGMDVMYISPTDSNVSIRGFNREGANKILTLVDGRPIYFELFGTTFWEALPVNIEDIEKIEIIRGPGSTLYGANAFNGVISIFTKDPQKNRGGKVVSRLGNYGMFEAVSSMGSDEFYSYRVSGGYTKLYSFENTDRLALKTIKVNSSFYFISDDETEKLSFHTGFINGRLNSLFSLIGTFDVNDYTYLYAQSVYENGGFKLNLLYDHNETNVSGGFPNPKSIYVYSEERGYESMPIDNFDIAFNNPTIGGTARRLSIDLQYQKTFFSRNKTLLGFTYRFSNFDAFGSLDNYSSANRFGAFIQNELKVGSFIFTMGFRGDLLDTNENYIKEPDKEVENILNFSPRGSLVYVINESNVLRFSVGKAFRDPTYLESNLRINILPEYKNEQGDIVREAINFNGTQDAQSEKITSYELAYSLNAFNERLKFNVNVFYNVVKDLILFRGDIKGLLEIMLGRGDNIKYKDKLFTFNNNVDANNYGGEISFDWFVNQYFSFYANYSYQKTQITNEEKLKKIYKTQDIHKITTVDLENPSHKINLGLRLAMQGVFFNIFASYVSESERRNFITEISDLENSVPIIKGGSQYIAIEANSSSFYRIPAWITLNANLKYRFLNDKVTLGVTAYDILGSFENVSKEFDSPFKDGKEVGYKGTIKNPTGIIDGRHIEYPRSNLFGKIMGGDTMGRRIYGYLEFDF